MRISGNFAGPEDGMADKKKDTNEGGSATSTKADKASRKKAAVTEAEVETAPEIAPSTKSTKIPKLAKKDKSRLPRREKKARQKGR
jgi:hypothetical protein